MRLDQEEATEIRAIRWTLPLIFTCHAIDEYVSGFPEWATRHFGTTSRRFYVASHILLIASLLAVSLAAERRRAHLPLESVLASVAAGLVANGLFHLETTWRFRQLSPGVLTSVTLMIPGGSNIFIRLLREERLDKPDVLRALAGGTALNAAAVLSLRLDMPTLGSETTS